MVIRPLRRRRFAAKRAKADCASEISHQETHEEYALSRPAGLREALLIVALFVILSSDNARRFCTVDDRRRYPAAGSRLWAFRAAVEKRAAGNSSLANAPPLGTVWGECNQEQIYPSASSTLFTLPTGNPTLRGDSKQQTDIDIYLDRHVGSPGRFLSLHDEAKNFPLQHCYAAPLRWPACCWCCLCCCSRDPADVCQPFTLSWMKGAKPLKRQR